MTSISSPIPRKTLPLFAVHALVLSLLIGSWPSLRAVYPDLFRGAVEPLLWSGQSPEVALSAGSVRGEEVMDSFVEGLDEDRGTPRWRIAFSTLRMGYWPSAVMCALLLATPLATRRRVVALLLGLVWTGVYSVGRLQLEVWRAEAELAQGGAAARAEGSVLLYRTASEVFGSNIFEIAIVLLGWVLLANPQRVLEMGALARLLGGGPRASR